ncbi:hypothetical protein [Aggregatibacter segnis]|uniref:hypothetical protein n=1 Tax=Aggregatibacter segnis TaxID=739 RepID=UPI000D64E5C7|nr:hypothetical protein [Aggregatibacter segnis]
MITVCYAPEALCLYEIKYIPSTLNFISKIYDLVQSSNRVILDFSRTKTITAAASVVLFAHVNRIQLFRNNPNLFVFRCKNSPLYQSFFIPCYLQALQAGTEEKLKRLEQQKHLYQSGTLPHLKLAALKDHFKIVRMNYPSQSTVFKTLLLLETAMYEALLNVNHHAYLGVNPQSPTRWWQQLRIDIRNNQLSFIVYDLGIGIVESYLEHGIANITSLFHSKTDILRDILKPGVSRWNSIERGNGFTEMLRPSQFTSNVGTWIFSNNLHFEYFPKFKIDFCEEMPYTVPGTLIEWVVDLKDD